MKQGLICPSGEKCLLSQTGADRNCEICSTCRDGNPLEFAVHVKHSDGLSRVLRFADLPHLVLDKTVEQVCIYRLAGEKYYARESISFQPESSDVKQALFAQVKAW